MGLGRGNNELDELNALSDSSRSNSSQPAVDNNGLSELDSLSLLSAPPEKKKAGATLDTTGGTLDLVTGGLEWVNKQVSSFNSAVDAGKQKISQWVVDKVKEQNGFKNDEEAVSFLKERAQMQSSVDQYKSTLDSFGVKAPQEFFAQPYDKLAKWYFDQKDKVNKEIEDVKVKNANTGREYGTAFQQRIEEMGAMPADQKAIVDQKIKQLKDLEGIKNTLIATKLATLEDPKRIGFEYMRLFSPGQYEQVMARLQKVSPALNDPKLAAAEIEVGSDAFLFKAFPQNFLYENERQGLQVLANAHVENLKQLTDPYQALRIKTLDERKAVTDKFKGLYNAASDGSGKAQVTLDYNAALHEVDQRFYDTPLVSSFLKSQKGLASAVKDYWNAEDKYPEVKANNFIKGWVEDTYNDQDVVSRQLLMKPGLPGQPTGAYGFFGRLAKSAIGTGKDAIKSLNAGLAAMGIKDSDDAYFDNYQLDQDWETLAYTPSEQGQRKTVGYKLPESVKKIAADIGYTPEAFSFMGKPKTVFNMGGVIGTMGDLSGQVLGQAVLSQGAGGVFNQVIGDLGKGAELVGAGEAASKATKWLRRPEITQDRVGLFASTAATSYGTSYSTAIDAGLTKDEAEHYANASWLGSALTELINPESKMLRNAQGKITGSASIKEMMGVLGNESLSNKERILQFTKGYLKNAAVTAGKETFEEVLDQVKQHGLDAIYGINTTNMGLVDDVKQTAITTAIGMVPMALMGAYGQSHALRKEALYRVGENPDIVQSYYEKQLAATTDPVEKENIQEKFNAAMKITNTMAGIIKALPEKNMQGRELTLEEKAALAEQIFKNRKLSADAHNLQDEVLSTPVQAEANLAQQNARDIVAGTNPTYIINGRSYSKQDFTDFIGSEDYKNAPDKFALEVHNDDEVSKQIAPVILPPEIDHTEESLSTRQNDLQGSLINLNSKVVELSESKPGSAELADAETAVQQTQGELKTVDERLASIRKNKKEVANATPPNNMAPANTGQEQQTPANIEQKPAEIAAPEINPQAASAEVNPQALAAQPAPEINPQTETPAAPAPTGGVPVIRSQGQPIEQAKPSAESDKVGANIKEKFNAAPKAIANHVIDSPLPNGETVRGRYALVPATSVTASHNPFSFASSEGYPLLEDGKNPNDRNYGLSENKAQVVSASLNYDGRAVQNIPTVTPDGVVIDGNQRTMSGQLAAVNKTDAAYLASLQQRLPFFGFTQEDYNYVAAHGAPRLVFITEKTPAYNTQTFAAYNQQEKKEKSPMARAVELGRTVSDDVITRIGNEIEGFNTLSEFYADKKATNNVFDTLVQNGVLLDNELPGYYSKESRTLTERGKEFLESLMLGKLVSEDNLNVLNKDGIKNYRQKIVRAIRPLTEIESLGPDFSLKGLINAVIGLKDRFEQYKQQSKLPNLPLETFLAQRSMFDENLIDPETVIAFYFMEGTQTEFKNFANGYLERARPAASGAVDMFASEPASKQNIVLSLSQRLQNEQRAIIEAAQAARNVRQQAPAAENNGGNENAPGGSAVVPAASEPAQAEPANAGGPSESAIVTAHAEMDGLIAQSQTAYDDAVAEKAAYIQKNGYPAGADRAYDKIVTTVRDAEARLEQFKTAKENLLPLPKNIENATPQSEPLQNQEVPAESGGQQHSGIDAGQQEQAQGQEAQPVADNSNSNSGDQAQTQTLDTATTKLEATQRAIELLNGEERKKADASLDDFLDNLDEHLNSGINASMIFSRIGEVDPDLEDAARRAQFAAQTRLEKALDKVRAAMKEVTRSKKVTVFESTGDPLLDELLKDHAKAVAFDARRDYAKQKRALAAAAGRVRGVNHIIERLSKAARAGDITQEAADMAIDLIRAAPGLFDDLAISITGQKNPLEVQGYYHAADQLMKIFKGSDPVTGTHELFHHTERFLPLDMRERIAREWATQVEKQIKVITRRLEAETDEKVKENLTTALLYLKLAQMQAKVTSAQSMQAIQQVMKKYGQQLGQSFYQLFNPSEWWAVNAQQYFQQMREQPRQMSFMQKIFSWYKQLIKSAKNAFGFNAIREVEKGVDAILSGKTLKTMQGDQMSSSPVNFLSAAYTDQRRADAINYVERALPLGYTSFDDILNRVKARPTGHALLPYIAQAYKEVRDNPSLLIAANIRAGMTDDANIDKIAAKEIGSSDAEVAAIGSMFVHRIFTKGQTISDATEEVNLLPVSRDRRTAILDYINEQITSTNPSNITVEAQRQKTVAQKVFTAAAKFGKEQMTVGGLIPKALRLLKEQEMGLRNEWTVKIKHIAQDFEQAVKEQYGGSKPTQQQRESMDAALRGSATELARHGPKVQASIQTMRNFVDGLTQNLVKDGVIPAVDAARADLETAKEQGAPSDVIRALEFKFQLAKTVEDRMGTYINRQYEKHRSKDFAEKIKADQKKIQAATNYLYNVALINQGKQLTPEEIQQVIDTIISHDDIDMLLKQNAMSMDLSVLKHMEDIPGPIRDIMGEIKDPEWNFVNTAVQMATLLERHHMLNNMWQAGKGVYFSQDLNIPDGHTEPIKNRYWGPLTGKFTTPELAEALADWNRPLPGGPWDNALNLLKSATSWAKAAKTSLSWVSEIGNILGNGVMLFQNGNFAPSEFKNALKVMQDIFGKVKSPASRAMLERLARLNITNHSLPASEINNISRELFDIVPDNVDWNPSLIKKIGKKITGFKTKSGEVYGATDDIFKAIAFFCELGKLEKAYKASNVAKTDDELDQEAAYIATHIMPTFYKVPKMVRGISQHFPIVGNFVSYPIELLRTTYNTVQLAAEQLRSQNPEIRKIGAKRLTWFLGTQAGTSIFPSLIAMLPGVLGMGGGDGDDRDAINELLPDYYKNVPNNIIKGNDGNYYVHLMSRLDGQDWFKEIFTAAIRGDGFDKVTGPVKQLAAPFANQNMVLAKIMQYYANADQYGKPIYNPEDTEAHKAWAITKHFGDLVTPQTINDITKTTSSFVAGDTDKGLLGIVRLGTGQTVMKINPKQIIGIKINQFDHRLRDAKKIPDRETRLQQMNDIRLEKKDFLLKVSSLRK